MKTKTCLIFTGLIPLMSYPELKRDNKHVGDVICLHKLNKKGELVENGNEK